MAFRSIVVVTVVFAIGIVSMTVVSQMRMRNQIANLKAEIKQAFLVRQDGPAVDLQVAYGRATKPSNPQEQRDLESLANRVLDLERAIYSEESNEPETQPNINGQFQTHRANEAEFSAKVRTLAKTQVTQNSASEDWFWDTREEGSLNISDRLESAVDVVCRGPWCKLEIPTIGSGNESSTFALDTIHSLTQELGENIEVRAGRSDSNSSSFFVRIDK